MLDYSYKITTHSPLKYGIQVTVKDPDDPGERPNLCTEWLIATCVDNRPIIDGEDHSAYQMQFELVPSSDLDELPPENVALVRAMGTRFTVTVLDEDDAEEIAEEIRKRFEANEALPNTLSEWNETIGDKSGA